MDLKNIRTFIYVAELANFTKAAELLGFSQSTVSFQIKQLENELNVKLFERINHTVKLTEQGRGFLKYAHEMDKLTQEMAVQLREEKEITGHIRVAMADSLCVLFGERLEQFWLRNPKISLKVVAAGTEEMIRLLNHNEVDLVFTLDNHIYDTEYHILREEKINTHFVAAFGFPLADGRPISIYDIITDAIYRVKNMDRYDDREVIITNLIDSYRRLMDERLAALSLEVHSVFETGNTEVICRLVEQGAGCSFLPDYVTEAGVKQGRLVRLLVEDFQIDVWKQLICHRDKWISPQMEAVMEYCVEI